MDGGQPLTTYLSAIFCLCLSVCVYVCVHICVCVCGYVLLFARFVCVYLSLCVCVFSVRSSAGGDHGGAGEERREHAWPHHLRRN